MRGDSWFRPQVFSEDGFLSDGMLILLNSSHKVHVHDYVYNELMYSNLLVTISQQKYFDSVINSFLDGFFVTSIA